MVLNRARIIQVLQLVQEKSVRTFHQRILQEKQARKAKPKE